MYIKLRNKMSLSDSEEEAQNRIQCIHCKSIIEGKPWITVFHKEKYIYGCKYMCSKQLACHIGHGYWENVVNKEDFSEPRPVTRFQVQKDLTSKSYFNTQIRDEIDQEQRMVDQDEQDYQEQYDEFTDEEHSE